MRDSRSCSHWWPVVTLLAVALASYAAGVQAQTDPVTITVSGDAIPGGTVTATITINDSSTLQSVAWTQVGGAAATLSGADTATVTVALAALSTYKDHLFTVLVQPPLPADELPPNVPPPGADYAGGLQNRFEVVALNPFALEEGGLVTLQADVVTSSGTYHPQGTINTTLPWTSTTGLRNLPTGLPVLLHGKTQASYDWDLASPGGSSATLTDGATQNPQFTPDVDGHYTLTVTDLAAGSAVTLSIYAGTWRGVIIGKDSSNNPVADATCRGCHNGSVAPAAFTPWAASGHAHIFSDNLDTSTHYGPDCFSCHTVGYNTTVANGGFDDAADYQAFLAAGLLNVPGDNWTTMLATYPAAAKLANIQCENCHGPQQSDAHMQGSGARGSLSSDLCGSCHGEPLRHGRFQQWQLSGHANYQLATQEGMEGNCSRCHTANGFLAWVEQGADPNSVPTVTWTQDEIHPQTCQACHDPHDAGTTSASGGTTDATVRISGNTPLLLAGFTATDVGKGAICLTCHNSRRGLRDDSNFGTVYGTSEASRAPHVGTQADLLMGQNLYNTATGTRGPHANVPNACVSCHMVQTPPPPGLSYNATGTNHTFYASTDICSSCHTDGRTAATVQGPVQTSLTQLEELIEEKLLTLVQQQIAGGNSIDLGGLQTITDAATISHIEFGETSGRQAITVTFTDSTAIGPVGMNSVKVVPPGGGTQSDLYSVANPNLIKAGWNWLMVTHDSSLGVHNPDFVETALASSIDALQSAGEPCVANANTLCLNNNRFKVQVNWRDFQGNTGVGTVASCGTGDSGIFYFFTEDNWEMLLKVLDGCSVNQHYWVFFAATTNVEFTTSVTDTLTGQRKTYSSMEYTNPLGQAANAVTDTSAFATCP